MNNIRGFLILFCLLIQATSSFAIPVDEKNLLLARETLNLVRGYHYDPAPINDAFAQRVSDSFLKRLDARKRFFLQSDIEMLNKLKNSIDEDLQDPFRGQTFGFYRNATDIQRIRTREIQAYVTQILAQPLDYTKPEFLESDIEKLTWRTSKEDLEDYWRLQLKYEVIQRYLMIVETKNKPIGKSDEEVEVDPTINFLPDGKMIAEYEQEARDKILKRYNTFFKRLLEQSAEDVFASYLDTVMNAFDPHTSYMEPVAKEEFQIEMTGHFEGIGARLSEEDGFIKITEIIPGSPSWRQGELQPEDLIIKVAQGDGEPEDVVDMAVNDAVKLIRGKKGTEVRLTVKKPSGELKVIPLIRDTVIVEDSYAKGFILDNTKLGKRYGYIQLPKFYRDFQNRKSRNATDDVKNILLDFKDKNLDGIILDLRNNGGGALNDAVGVAGLFFDSGPVVQVQDKRGYREPEVQRDIDGKTYYDGRLVVLINQFSASASEICAAALQDQQRAVVIGSGRSFGKGTVQNLIDLDRQGSLPYTGKGPFGSLKMTTQKYYRIDGTTTQFNGVISDVVLPGPYDFVDIGEREYPYAMTADTIATSSFKIWKSFPFDNRLLAASSKKRIEENPLFREVVTQNDKARAEREKSLIEIGLQTLVDKRRENLSEAREIRRQWVEKDYISVELRNFPEPRTEEERKSQSDLVTGIRKDIYLEEAMNILHDWIGTGLTKTSAEK